jgi:hypothetical protein
MDLPGLLPNGEPHMFQPLSTTPVHGADDSAVLHVPDLALVVAGDAVYNGAHQFLGEPAGGGRDAWRAATQSRTAQGRGKPKKRT